MPIIGLSENKPQWSLRVELAVSLLIRGKKTLKKLVVVVVVEVIRCKTM